MTVRRRTLDLLTRAKARGWYTCPCGRRALGADLDWPKSPFYVRLYQLCAMGAACGTHPEHHEAAPGVREVLVTFGPYPADRPVCMTHTVCSIPPQLRATV